MKRNAKGRALVRSWRMGLVVAAPLARLGGAVACAVACVLAGSACTNENTRHEADRRGTFIALGSLPGYAYSEAAAVSADGSIIVGTSTSAAGFRQAVRWVAPQVPVALGFLGGGTSSHAKGVSADGDVIIGDADGGMSSGLHAFRSLVSPFRQNPVRRRRAIAGKLFDARAQIRARIT